MNKTIIAAITGAAAFITLGTTAVQASTVHKVTGMKNVPHSARVVLNDYRSRSNNKQMYSLVRKNRNNYTMKSVHYIHNFTKFTLIKSAKISGKMYYYVKSPAGYTGWIWNGYLGMNTSYVNGSGNVTVKGNTTNFYNHVSGGDYKSRLSHYGHNYRNRTMQINKLAKKSGTSGYYLRVKYNGKTWGWIHQNGVSYKGSSTHYYSISNKQSVTIKKNATDDFYNHVNGGNYLGHLIHYGKNYRGKKFTTDMKAKRSGVSGYFYRVYYNGKNYGWIYQNALNIGSTAADQNSGNSSSNANHTSSSSNTSNNSNSQKPTKPNNNSSSASSNKPATSNSSSSKPVAVKGKVQVAYEDEYGISVANATTIEGNVGSNYTTSAKKIKGYQLVKTPSNANGTYTKNSQSVTYTYRMIDVKLDTSKIAQAIIDETNAQRKANGLSEHTVNTKLTQAATVRAKETSTLYSHTRPNGSAQSTAIDEAGYNWQESGENLAAFPNQTQTSDPVAFGKGFVSGGWMLDVGHKHTILTPEFQDIGVAVYYDSTQQEYFAVQEFGVTYEEQGF